MGWIKQTLCGLLIICLMLSFSPIAHKSIGWGSTGIPPDIEDEIDQEQIIATRSGSVVDPEDCIAQSFKPTMELLTRIQIRLEKFNNITSDAILIIRDHLTGKNLTYANVSSSTIPDTPTWIEFDFPDIEIIPEKTYYMICKTNGGNWARKIFYKWSCTDVNPYPRGQLHCSVDGGKSWQPDERYVEKDQCFRTYGIRKGENQPPEKPQRPLGQNSGKIGKVYTYSTSSTDLNGDQIYYQFDWGDETHSEWLGPYHTGEECSASHTWTTRDNYEIKAKAKDTNDAESEWSDSLLISMPKAYHNALALCEEQNMYYLLIVGREIMPLPSFILTS